MALNHFGCVGNTIKAWAGHYVDLENPTPDMFDLKTIAAALGKLCRFGGHSPLFYSVAEHCVHATDVAARFGQTEQVLREVLLHDAAEAYVGDIVKPLKVLLPKYEEIEAKIESAIAERFGLSGEHRDEIKRFDRYMLKAEKQAMWPEDAEQWEGFGDIGEVSVRIECWSPSEAPRKFLERAVALGVN